MSPLNVAHDSVSTHIIVAFDAIAIQLTPVKHVTDVGEVFDTNVFAFLVVIDIEIICHICFIPPLSI
jgi:hypothetical protein